jgi:hypothetical protein
LTNWKVDIQGTSDVDDNTKNIESSPIISSGNTETKEARIPTGTIDDKQTDVKEKGEKEEILAKETEQSAQDELLALEKELEELEKQEKLEKDSKENEMLDVSSDELWQVDNSMFNTSKKKKEENTGIRFAEDISGFYETDEGRKGGKRGGSSAKSKRRK